MFKKLFRLRSKLIQNELTDIDSEDISVTSFEWFPPASYEQILEVEKRLAKTLPQDYNKFLGEVSNGAVLFYDKEYSQWGYKLYSTTEFIEKQIAWKKRFPVTWESGLIAFGELYGEANVLVFDLRVPTEDSLSCMVLEGNAYDKFSDWPKLSRSFHEWLDHLITARGDKYWEWM